MLIDALTTADRDAPLASAVRFRSPFADYHGRDDVAHLVQLIRDVLGDVRVGRRLQGGADTMSVFEAQVADTTVQGVLVETRDDEGAVADAMLTIRPYAGLRTAMAAMLEQLDADPLPSRRAA